MAGSWNPKLETGIPDVDEQHRELVDAMGALAAALAISDEAAVRNTLECLTHYALVHFEEEERWMRANQFSLLREHVAKHDQFITRVAAMTKDHAEEGTTAVLRLRLQNALSWLEAHIADEDRDLAKHAAAVHRATAATVR